MPGRPRRAWEGRPVKNAPTGFPLYAARRGPRVVTSDIWAHLRYIAAAQLSKADETKARAFINQAYEFYEAADNPQLGSRPLLYYYSFLNLAKMALLVQGVNLPPSPRHGISDPRANQRTRLRLPGQTVRSEVCAADHSQIFPEVVRALGGNIARQTHFRVDVLLSQIPGVHRTYCRVLNQRPLFVPIVQFSLHRQGQEIWARLHLSRSDNDVNVTLRALRRRQSFRRVFDQVESEEDDELWFETGVVHGPTRQPTTRFENLPMLFAKSACGQFLLLMVAGSISTIWLPGSSFLKLHQSTR